MKHFIIVKFRDRNDTQKLLPEITELFNRTLEIPGVESVQVHPSNSTRENRYSLMIEMTLTPEALAVYDGCEAHRTWKAVYADRIESKAIFDCES